MIFKRKIMQTFRTYMAVGGMPQAVDAFVSGQSWQAVDKIKRRILRLYEEDLGKFDEETGAHAATVFKTLPEQLENHNSHFKFSLLDKNARYKHYVEAINAVVKSMIGNECIGLTAPEISMELYADRSNFKLYMGDTGLLITRILMNNKETDENIYRSLIFRHTGFNMGMVMENVVAQILRACGNGLYFHEYYYQSESYSRERKYEIDFLLVRNKRICPIEVKSSGTGKHRSFDYFLKKYPVKVKERYIISTKPMRKDGNLLYLPVYMTGCL